MRSMLILAAAAAVFAPAAHAATFRLGQLEAGDPWSRPAAAGMNGAGFVTLTNRGKAADRLMSVETTAAKKAEIHQSLMTNGVASMKRQDAGVAIPAGQAVAFAPGGYHVMFLGLTKALKGGDKVPATLVFQSGTKMKVEFEVRGAGAAPMPKGMEHMNH